ncbi:MAG TPA: class I SAM-dependent methyltransferase [Bacteroidales bacterium]|jgi:ubiquinone/menaquinone biosynthesis C-methylase UbiE|nr:class I SAM-dependent methyltransferase [Bacteroidales bacterium]HPB25341.1 class I SAM-dependent methyltransferase [Bacteroidales bacterium]HPI31286.1 class I SAM-dependent methyltransferase [Bacteroidales bacterium]HQP15502.1 class I SAM-dependent methyltransferase [Bacteroidales bacterium]
MKKENELKVCPVEIAGMLDNSFRRLFQNPGKIIAPHVSKGMTVLDLGCGPGFFSIEIAKKLHDSGKVIAADIQEGMLEKVRKKIKGTDIEYCIEIHKCKDDTIGITQKVDLIFAFWVIHEMPELDRQFEELISILKPGGKIYIIEPKFHVSKKAFEDMIAKLKNFGFEIVDRPEVFFSRTVLLTLI